MNPVNLAPGWDQDPFADALEIMGFAVQEHLNQPCCPLGGGFIKMPRKRVDWAMRTIDPNVCIEEVNHQGTPLVVYRGTIPGAGDYTFAIEAESMTKAELRLRAAMNN